MNNQDKRRELAEKILRITDDPNYTSFPVKEAIELAQAVIEDDWVSVDEAPKDGARFIGLYKGGLVFTTWRQAYNVYKPREDGSSYVDGHRHEWVYDRGDALLGGTPIGWMPLTLKTHHPTED